MQYHRNYILTPDDRSPITTNYTHTDRIWISVVFFFFLFFFTSIFLPNNMSLELLLHQCMCGNISNRCKKKSGQHCKSTILHLKIYSKIRHKEWPTLMSMGSQRVGHNWATSLSLVTFMYWRRKWQPTPVFLPGESQGRGSLVGCCLWGRTQSDMTEAT